MVNSPDYLARDRYDVVAPYIEDRDALDHAFASLDELESLALSYDAESGPITVSNVERISEAAYCELIKDPRTRSRFGSAVLSRDVSYAMKEGLRTTKAEKARWQVGLTGL